MTHRNHRASPWALTRKTMLWLMATIGGPLMTLALASPVMTLLYGRTWNEGLLLLYLLPLWTSAVAVFALEAVRPQTASHTHLRHPPGRLAGYGALAAALAAALAPAAAAPGMLAVLTLGASGAGVGAVLGWCFAHLAQPQPPGE